MAFDIDFLGKVSSSGNTDALKVWTYNGTSTGSNETEATISASGYFNSMQQVLTSGSEEGPIQVGDVFMLHGNDANGMYVVTSISSNVTLSSFAAVSAISTAQIQDQAVDEDKLNTSVAGDGLSGGGGTPLSVNVDDSTIETSSDTLQVKALGIDSPQLAANSVTNNKLAEDTIQYAEVTVTTAEMKDLVTNQKELVAAPGADKFIDFLGAKLILDFNSAAYTESDDNMVVKFTDDSGVAVSEVIEATGFVDQTADTITNAVPVKDAIVAASGAVNQALVLDNNGSDYAAGDSPVRIQVVYRVVTAGL